MGERGSSSGKIPMSWNCTCYLCSTHKRHPLIVVGQSHRIQNRDPTAHEVAWNGNRTPAGPCFFTENTHRCVSRISRTCALDTSEKVRRQLGQFCRCDSGRIVNSPPLNRQSRAWTTRMRRVDSTMAQLECQRGGKCYFKSDCVELIVTEGSHLPKNSTTNVFLGSTKTNVWLRKSDHSDINKTNQPIVKAANGLWNRPEWKVAG